MFGYFKVRREILELREDFEKLRRGYQTLQLEWSEAYDKIHHLMQRLAKRDALQKPQQPEAPIEQREDGSAASSLSLRQQEINAQIMARRNRTHARPQ